MERLGWMLVHFLWQGALVGMLAWLAAASLRETRTRYAMFCGALLVMAMCPIVTFSVLGDGPTGRLAPLSLTELGTQMPPALATSAAPLVGRGWMPWVVCAWIAGVLLCSARLVGGWFLVLRLAQDRMSVHLAWARAVAGEIRVFATRRIDVPMVVGYLRPFVLLPMASLANLPVEQLEAILAHEVAHIQRRDPLVNLLQSVVETLLFYHPVVWWVSRQIREERENCCDDDAVRACGTRRLYAEALLALEQARGTAPAMALSMGGGTLVRRVARLSGQENASLRSPVPAVFALLVLAFAGIISVQTMTAQKSAPQPVSAYQKWLVEDVDLIITPAERAAFVRLKDDAEREHFIEQFWDRRNPTPGSTENAFKREHYRRINYANQRFAGDIPGSKTVRGRLYILAGPPDEIESHPGNWEAWRYRSLEDFGPVTFTSNLKTGTITKLDATTAARARLEHLIARLNRR